MNTEQIQLARNVADWAERNVSLHDQGEWIENERLCGKVTADTYGKVQIQRMKEDACGTRACVAGRIAIDRTPPGTETDGVWLYFSDGTEKQIADFAAEKLGIYLSVAEVIFYSPNNPTAILRLRYLADHPDATVEDMRRQRVEAEDIWQ